jgi:uncharacterized membrane protein
MSTIEKSIDVNVPSDTAYNLWTQFEQFPRFMEGVEEVRQINAKHLNWRVNVGGKQKEFETEITEQIPGKRIAWRTVDGTDNAGVVTFHRLTGATSRIMVQMAYEPEGLMEKAGDLLGIASHRVQGDLERFKQYIERSGSPTVA